MRKPFSLPAASYVVTFFAASITAESTRLPPVKLGAALLSRRDGDRRIAARDQVYGRARKEAPHWLQDDVRLVLDDVGDTSQCLRQEVRQFVIAREKGEHDDVGVARRVDHVDDSFGS